MTKSISLLKTVQNIDTAMAKKMRTINELGVKIYKAIDQDKLDPKVDKKLADNINKLKATVTSIAPVINLIMSNHKSMGEMLANLHAFAHYINKTDCKHSDEQKDIHPCAETVQVYNQPEEEAHVIKH